MSKVKKGKSQRNLFEYEERLEKINKVNTPLDKLKAIVDFELFRDMLTDIFEVKNPKGKGGAPHYDYVFMFKIFGSSKNSFIEINSLKKSTPLNA